MVSPLGHHLSQRLHVTHPGSARMGHVDVPLSKVCSTVVGEDIQDSQARTHSLFAGSG